MAKNLWSRVEDMSLMEYKRKGLGNKEIGFAIDRTAKAVECRWRELRRGMGKRNVNGTYVRSDYDESEFAIMKQMYKDGYTQWQIANVLGKSESAIGNQLYLMRKRGEI